MEFKKVKFIETENRMLVTRIGEMEGNGEMLVKGTKLPYIGRVSSRDLTYSLTTILNNTVFWQFSKKINFRYSYHTKKR